MKTSLNSYYQTNRELETKGTWVETESGAKFLLKRMGGKNQKKINEARAKYFMGHIDDLKEDKMPEEEQEKLFIKVFVESCLVDWKNVFDSEDNQVPYDPELAEQVLFDCPDLFDELINYSNSRKEFKKVEDLGNS